ncbi:MAG TPA: 50S ribosomal protein L11 methyltransferase [Tissierellia bacterium]|nr:50S ribosomal protein L11 methyltransferase [Tissierellia bacterium]
MKHLVLHVSHEAAAWFEEILSGYDISGLSIENDQDPAYTELDWHWDEALIPPAQDDVRILVYGNQAILEQIKSELADRIIRWHWAEQPDENWMQKWMDEFRGFAVGETLYVQPVHDQPSPDRINLIIQAGMAFGTGTHETTMGCLEALEKYIRPEDQVIDIGSGSGILSIAAIKLGAAAVRAVEIDPTALANAAENRRLNGVERVIEQYNGDLAKDLSQPCHLMVANILPEVLLRLVGDAKRLIIAGGYLILSGIISKRVDELLAAYDHGFRLVEIITKGDWNTLVFQRQDA